MPLDQVDVDAMSDEKEMSFIDHLEELRWHLIRAISAIFVAAIVVFCLGKGVFEHVVLAPKSADFATYRAICALSETICFYPPDFVLETKELGEQFLVHLKVAIMLGLIIAFPYIFWEFWRFIKPGLYPDEQKAVRGIVLICSLLFYSGVLFGYYIISPFAVTFLAGYDVGAISAPTLASFVSYMTMFTLPTGFVFELPIVVYFLAKVGLITPEFMKQYRRHAFVLILMLAAIITPPDVTTQFLIGMPLYVLYEISIGIARRVVKQQEKQALLEAKNS